MTLESKLLEKLSEWQPAAGRQELFVSADGWNTTVNADRSDALGTLLWELTLRREGTCEVNLEKWAMALATRIGGLMDALKIVEIDTTRNQAQLRSATPQKRGEKRLYYELLLSGLGSAVLRRFEVADATATRQQIAFAMTHEAVATFAADVANAA